MEDFHLVSEQPLDFGTINIVLKSNKKLRLSEDSIQKIKKL